MCLGLFCCYLCYCLVAGYNWKVGSDVVFALIIFCFCKVLLLVIGVVLGVLGVNREKLQIVVKFYLTSGRKDISIMGMSV